MQTTVYFNRDIKPALTRHLQAARQEVLLAVAWLNDEDLFALLKEKAQDAIKVAILITEDPTHNKLDYHTLADAGATVYRYAQEDSLMHHKFCLIDGQTLITGSYNWTFGASLHNQENIVVIQNDKTSFEQYRQEFQRLIDEVDAILKAELQQLEAARDEAKDRMDQVVEAFFQHVEKYKEIPTRAQLLVDGNNEAELPALMTRQVRASHSPHVSSVPSSAEERSIWWDDRLDYGLKLFFNKSLFVIQNSVKKPSDNGLKNILAVENIDLSSFWYLVGYKEKKRKYLDSIAGLDALIDLREVHFPNTSVSSLAPLKGLAHLEKLSCFGTMITSLADIAFMPALKRLECNASFLRLPLEVKRLKELGFVLNEEQSDQSKAVFER